MPERRRDDTAGARAFGSRVEVHGASDSKRFYMLCDHRGSAHVLLDESKDVVATRLYNAFGETVSETGTWPDEVPLGYQSNWLALDGMTMPDGTRLYFSPTRIYDPGVGRFLQRDILPYLHKYKAWTNSPVMQVDRDALASVNQQTGSTSAMAEYRAALNEYEMRRRLLMYATRSLRYYCRCDPSAEKLGKGMYEK